MLSELEWMEYHISVLFKHDIGNRITVINEPPYEPAPRIFMGATKAGYIIRYSNLLDSSMLVNLEQVLETDPTNIAKLINILGQKYDLDNISFGPAYAFPDVRNRTCCEIIRVTNENKDILKPHFPYTYEDFEYKQPCFVKMVDKKIVSICCSARQTSMADEASLFTNEHYRGKGYAIDVAIAWAQEVQNQGRLALYSTSWDNFASQSVARKLQLVQYGTDISID